MGSGWGTEVPSHPATEAARFWRGSRGENPRLNRKSIRRSESPDFLGKAPPGLTLLPRCPGNLGHSYRTPRCYGPAGSQTLPQLTQGIRGTLV